jgi:Porin subfamily
MKSLKRGMLLSAAGLLVVAEAQAADLPVKAAPVEYVKVCSLYGAGFFYIPGTDTCLKVGGYLRSDHIYGMANAGGYYMSTPGATETRTGSDMYNLPRPHEFDRGLPDPVRLRHDPRLRGDRRSAIDR